MEFIAEIVGWVFRGVFYFVCWAVIGCCQAMAGVLHPSNDSQTIHLQRWAGALLASSLVLFVIGLLLVNSLAREGIGYGTIVVSLMLMIAAGFTGKQAERSAKRYSEQVRDVNQ